MDGHSRPLVSVIVATSNRAHCLPHALDSIYGQKQIGQAFDVETIVVDDGSTDDTPEVIRRYRQIKYIRLAERKGVSAAKNRALKASRGHYITFLDDDDEWLPHKLQIQVAALETHSNIGVVYGQTIVRSNGGEGLCPPDQAPSGQVFVPLLMRNFCGHHACLLIRRSAFASAGYFDESLVSYEDWDLSLRLAFHVAFLFIPGTIDIHNVSPRGLWMSRDINGVSGADARRALEKNLRMLPEQQRYVEVKRRARALLALETASRFSAAANPWTQVLATLREYPEILGDMRAKELVTEVLNGTIRRPRRSILNIRKVCSQLKAAARRCNTYDRRWVKQTLAPILTAIARAPQTRARDKRFAAFLALSSTPFRRSNQKLLIRLMILTLLGTRAEGALISLWNGLTRSPHERFEDDRRNQLSMKLQRFVSHDGPSEQEGS